MPTTNAPPRDVLLPAALWSALEDPSADVALLLALWARADRDGIVPVAPTMIYDGGLERLGLAVVYVGSGDEPVRRCSICGGTVFDVVGGTVCSAGHGGAPFTTKDERQRFAWLPDVPLHAPPASLRRPEEPGWQPPSPKHVARILAIRLGRPPTEAECRAACPRAYGRRRPAAPPSTASPIDRVFAAWAKGHDHPERFTLSATYRGLIEGALREVGGDPDGAADALILLFKYVFEADEAGPKFLRGETSPGGRTYLGLDNLLVRSKLQTRIAAAREWSEKRYPDQDEPGGGDGVDLGPLGRFFR